MSMSSKRPLIIGAVVAVLAAAGLVLYLSGKKKTDTPAANASAGPAPKGRDAKSDAPKDPGGGGGELNVLIDDDREGTLQLEGIVVDGDEKPVKGATVTVSTNPPRSVKSEDDGTFAFAKLVSRQYELVARAETGVAGPVTARLTSTSDPVTLHLVPAAGVEVTVVEAADKTPVVGATVELRDLETIAGTTGADGKVMLASVAAGGYTLVAWAPGHAKAYTWIGVARQSGDTPVVERKQIELRKGAAVAGTVRGTDGKPVAGALVVYSGTSDWQQQADPRRDAVKTDAAGAFRFEALPAGTFRFSARQEEYAPGASAPITLDGANEKTGVDIVLEIGGKLAGKVVSRAGAPVDYATVRVAVKVEGMSWDPARQTFTDEQGRFELKGLPRKKLDVVALHETAASETVAADLTTADKTDLTITLDLDGTIAGIVVDTKGEPIAEADVWAIPDFRKGNGDRQEWSLRGRAEERADAGGHFVLRGLRPGPYIVRANRPGKPSRGFMRKGEDANVGDTTVKIVLESDGGVKGKVQLADGSAPELFTVGFGMGGNTPFTSADGAFQLNDVPPGEIGLTISGPQFDRKVIQIKVEADKVHDAGTIIVAKGRTVSGRVVTAAGEPVVGAAVFCGRRIGGDGSKPSTQSFGPPGMGNTKTATTDEQGTYTVYGVGAKELALLADHDTLGRSPMVQIPPGNEPVTVDLTLAPFGALEGKVTKGGVPVENVIVNVSSQKVPNTNFGVASGPDGAYRFDKLAPDTYLVSAMASRGMMNGMGFHTSVATVVSGQTATINLEMITGDGTLLVKPVLKSGGEVSNFAMVWFTDYPIVSTVAEQLEDEIAAHGAGFSAIAFTFMGNPAKKEDLKPGTYTVCAIPFPAEVKGMQPTMDYMMREGERLPVFCQTTDVRSGEQTLHLAIELPKFVPPEGTPPGGTPPAGTPPGGTPPAGTPPATP